MPKIEPLTREDATEEQRRVGDPIFKERGHDYDGSFAILLHYPELAELADSYGSFLRSRTSLPRRLSEIIIAMTARHWTARFPWSAHFGQAIDAGVDAKVLEAIRVRARPAFGREDEEIVYDYVTALLANQGIPDRVHARAIDAFGKQGVIGMVSIVGWYGSLCLIANAFDLAVLDENAPPLPA